MGQNRVLKCAAAGSLPSKLKNANFFSENCQVTPAAFSPTSQSDHSSPTHQDAQEGQSTSEMIRCSLSFMKSMFRCWTLPQSDVSLRQPFFFHIITKKLPNKLPFHPPPPHPPFSTSYSIWMCSETCFKSTTTRTDGTPAQDPRTTSIRAHRTTPDIPWSSLSSGLYRTTKSVL